MRRAGPAPSVAGPGPAPGSRGSGHPEGRPGPAPSVVDGRSEARALHRRLLGLSARARLLVAGAVACGALGAAAVIVQAWGIAAVVGDVAGGRAPAWDGPLLLVLGAVVARAALAGGTELLGRRAAEHATHELRTRIAEKALAGRSGHVPGARRGEIAAAAVEGVDALADYHARAVPALALAAGVPVAVVAVIAWRSPVVGALLAVTIPVVVVFMVLVGQASAEHARERRRATAVLGAHFLEVVRGLPTLRANGREDAQVATLAAVSERHRAESMGALRVAFLSAYVLEFLAMLGTAIAAATVGVLLAEGHMDLETGLFVLLLAPEVYAPLRTAGQRFHAAEDGATAAARVLAFLDEPEPRRSAGEAGGAGGAGGTGGAVDRGGERRTAPDPGTAPLQLTGVRVAGGAGRPAALAGLDLELPAGRSIALVGPSGVGKSTVLALLARLRDPDEGSVRCGDVDLTAVQADDWWGRIAWLPQRPGLAAGRLDDALAGRRGEEDAEGLATGDAEDAERLAGRGRQDAPGRLDRWLDAVGAGPVLATMPEGLATRVGPAGRPLSAGQTQRLALAGVLASGAPLLLLDEPTAHLDHAAAARATDAILDAGAGRTLVVATHDADLAARCDVVVDLAETLGLRSADRSPRPATTCADPWSGADRERAGLPRSGDPAAPVAAPGEPDPSARIATPVDPDLVPSRSWRPVAFAVLGAVAALAVLGTSGWLVTRAAERPPVLALLCAIVVVRALGLIRAHARYAERLSSHEQALGELGSTRVHWYRRIARRVGAPGVPGSADLLTRFTSDVDELQHHGPRVVLPRIAAAAGGGLAVVAAAIVLPAAGAALAGGLLVAGVAAPALAARMARRALGPQGAARSALARDLDDALAHGSELAVRGRGPQRVRGLVAASRELGRLDRRHARAAATGQAATTLATGVGAAAVLVLGAQAAADDGLALVLLGALVLLALGAGDLALPLPEASMRAVSIRRARARLAEAVDGPPVLADPPASPLPLPARGALVARDLRHRPGGPGAPLVLDGVDLTLRPGERIALIGASGAGKSTLATLLARLADPDEGEVGLLRGDRVAADLPRGDGRPDAGGHAARLADADPADVHLGAAEHVGVRLADADPRDVRARIRLAGQDAHLFATSVRENVRIGAPGATDERIVTALRTAGLGAWLDALPAGLDTLVGEDGVAVSGGERQRLGLSRAVASSADVLLLDEPTAMLDPPTAAAVLADVLAATAGRAVLVVTHAGAGLDAFDRVLELRDGHLAEAAGTRRPEPATPVPADA